jgi:hypothetical protein
MTITMINSTKVNPLERQDVTFRRFGIVTGILSPLAAIPMSKNKDESGSPITKKGRRC